MNRLMPLMIATLFLGLAGTPAFSVAPGENEANPQAVEAVLAGERDRANAAWWGFDAEDATDTLQAAIDSGAPTLVVPNMGEPWIVEPIELASNQTIIFEQGVLVLAKEGAFRDPNDCLFKARNAENIVLRGHGATWRMRQEDYTQDPYEEAEWRHTLGLYGSSNVTIEGLRLELSGGDGIYIGRGDWTRGDEQAPEDAKGYCKDIVIRDVVADRHYRQGISVISVENLLIENTVLQNTGKPQHTAPSAGIDIEPNRRSARLVNIVLRNCIIEGNRRGFLLYSPKTERPISILVEDTYIGGGEHGQYNGIDVAAVEPRTRGTLEFRNVTVEGSLHNAARLRDKAADGMQVIFRECHFRNNGLEHYDLWGHQIGLPILFMDREGFPGPVGGVQFIDCLVQDDEDRPFLLAIRENGSTEQGLVDVLGAFRVMNLQRADVEVDMPTQNVHITVNGEDR